jgi:hypothetical protein
MYRAPGLRNLYRLLVIIPAGFSFGSGMSSALWNIFQRCIFLALSAVAVAGCASMMATAGSGLAGNLNVAIMNQDDPELVRDGAPAYLLMLDSFVPRAFLWSACFVRSK